MMNKNLFPAIDAIRCSNAVAAGTTEIDGSAVNMSNADGVLFAIPFGTITSTAVTSVKAQGSNDNSTWADIEGSGITVADTDDNKVVLLDVNKPLTKYVRAVVLRATANAVVDAILGFKYGLRSAPVTVDTTVQSGSKTITGKAAGTA